MAQNTQDLVRKLLGAATTELVNDVMSQAGVAVAQLMRERPYRCAFIVVNLSANTVYVGPFNTVSATHGIRLGPNGGTLILVWYEDFSLVTQEWFAVADAAGSDVLVVELLLLREPEVQVSAS